MNLTHPANDEIEVTVIGPGLGEAILIHIGDRKWITIDCCIDRTSNVNVPLHYLSQIGVDVSSEVKLVIASHWHDDHIKGLLDLLQMAKSARFSCSEALTGNEFCAFAAAHTKNITKRFSGGASEFFKILNYLVDSKRVPEFAGKDRRLWLIDPSNNSHNAACEVYTLSPSSGQYARFLLELQRTAANSNGGRFRAKADNQNNLAVVCQIIFGSESILLGADLEDDNDANLGWKSILASQGRPTQVSRYFKIPHHGSSNAHNDDVWTSMVQADAFAVVTPFDRLARPLPTDSDRARIKSKTKFGFITSDAASKSFRHDDKTVNAKLKEIGAVVYISQVAPGRVTYRWRIGSQPSYSLSQMARPL